MDQSYYLQFAPWLHQRIDDYISYLSQGGTREQVEQSGDWKTSKMRASETDACARYVGAKKRGEIEKAFNLDKLWQFEVANRSADIVKEAVRWAAKIENDTNRGSIYWDTYTENRMDPPDKDYAGTVDALFVGRMGQDRSKSVYIPVEIKRTNADKYEGITPTQVWQLVTYLMLYDAEAGYLVTIYNWYGANGTHKVWPVIRTKGPYGYYYQVFNPSTGNAVKFEGEEWPDNEEGENYFTETDLKAKVEEHYTYLKYSPDEAPYPHPNWRCGEIVPEEVYARAYTSHSTGQKFKAGDKKPNSGVIKFTCPLADLCWKKGTGTVDTWWERF